MSNAEEYEGYANRETWAVALCINNDKGWQEDVHAALRSVDWDIEPADQVLRVGTRLFQHYHAGQVIQDVVETTLEDLIDLAVRSHNANDEKERYVGMRNDIGSMWRVDWYELGALFLADLREIDEA
jgi:hypothetical protein